MKQPLLPLLLFTPLTTSHYIFSKLLINNTLSSDFQYTRDIAYDDRTSPPLWAKSAPIFNISSAAQTCGRSAFPLLNPTIQTATIPAGSPAAFHLSSPRFAGDTEQVVYHPGPGQVFLSALPAGLHDLNEYDGSGDWFKIAYVGPKNKTTFGLEGEKMMPFTVPKATPPGKYLARMEHFMPDPQVGQSQWFVACAHVEVVGGGGGTPGPFVRFPGAYEEGSPSLLFRDPETGYFPRDVSGYVMPEPEVWTGN